MGGPEPSPGVAERNGEVKPDALDEQAADLAVPPVRRLGRRRDDEPEVLDGNRVRAHPADRPLREHRLADGHRQLAREYLADERFRGRVGGVVHDQAAVAEDLLHPPAERIGHADARRVGAPKAVEDLSEGRFKENRDAQIGAEGVQRGYRRGEQHCVAERAQADDQDAGALGEAGEHGCWVWTRH